MKRIICDQCGATMDPTMAYTVTEFDGPTTDLCLDCLGRYLVSAVHAKTLGPDTGDAHRIVDTPIIDIVRADKV